MGLPLSRQTLINWHEKAAEYYFDYFIDCFMES
ncbi:hypothetical protein [Aerococcus urinae]